MLLRPLALASILATVAAVACVVTAVGLLHPAPRPDAPRPDASGPPAARAGPPPPVSSRGGAAAAPRAAAVLGEWDAARSSAWATGDAGALARLYTPRSAAGRHDLAMLRAWRSRGLVVEGLATQLLAVEPVARRPGAWTLRVTDRLVGGVATGAGVRRPLPADAATVRTVELRRVDGRWRVASVRVSLEPGPGSGG